MKDKINKFIKKRVSIEKRKDHGFKLIEVIVIMLVVAIIGIFIGSTVAYFTIKSKVSYIEVVSSTSDADTTNELQEFIDTYNRLLSTYYKELDSSELINNAINGMLESIEDPYSTYLNEEELKSFNERLTGDYKGIGSEIMVNDDDNVTISKPFENSPAIKAGLKPGDVVKTIDGVNALGMDLTEAVSLIKGPEGTTVELVIIRDDKDINVSIVRAEIEIPSITSKVIEKDDHKIGFIRIDIFSQITDTQFNSKLTELENGGIDSLIIDVRGNGGGYLHVVKNIISLFLDKDEIVYQVSDRDETEIIKDFTAEARDYEIVVLIDGGSASASEILAGALKESYGALLLGATSFGKGTVQETFELQTGGLVKFTTKKWLTPLGNWVNEIGIEPDKEVLLDEVYMNEPTDVNDTQLQAAITELIK